MKKFFDLCVFGEGFGEKVVLAEALGWSGICFVEEFNSGYKSFVSRVEEVRGESEIKVFSGALIKPEKAGDVVKLARRAVEVADFVLVSGGDEGINKAASECWEVDVLLHPEQVGGKDYMDQRNSGLDESMIKFMAERGIAVGVDFSLLLDSSGMFRVQNIARVRQNIMLAGRYGAMVVFVSGAKDSCGMRSPRDMLSVLLSIGVEAGYAKKIMLEYPGVLVGKSVDRRNPNVILKGLEIVSSDKEVGGKRMYGWY